MLKRILCLFIAFGFTKVLLAQQDAQFSHFMFNGLIQNPAVAGSKDALSILGLYRAQWVGFNGGPVNRTVSVHTPVHSINSGVGLHIYDDAIGLENSLSVMGSYAYKFDFETATLSVGINLGFFQKSLQGSKYDANDKTDFSFPHADVDDITLDIGIGALYSTDQYFLGASITHIPQTKAKYETAGVQGESEVQLVRHFYASAGYNFTINQDIELKPAALMKLDKIGTFPQVEVNAMLFYKQKLWGGLSYRHPDAMIGLAGFNINEKLKIGYSYDFTVSKLRQASDGSHEIFIGYDVPIAPKVRDNIIIRTPRFL